jgi:hypothetical protein
MSSAGQFPGKAPLLAFVAHSIKGTQWHDTDPFTFVLQQIDAAKGSIAEDAALHAYWNLGDVAKRFTEWHPARAVPLPSLEVQEDDFEEELDEATTQELERELELLQLKTTPSYTSLVVAAVKAAPTETDSKQAPARDEEADREADRELFREVFGVTKEQQKAEFKQWWKGVEQLKAAKQPLGNDKGFLTKLKAAKHTLKAAKDDDKSFLAELKTAKAKIKALQKGNDQAIERERLQKAARQRRQPKQAVVRDSASDSIATSAAASQLDTLREPLAYFDRISSHFRGLTDELTHFLQARKEQHTEETGAALEFLQTTSQ